MRDHWRAAGFIPAVTNTRQHTHMLRPFCNSIHQHSGATRALLTSSAIGIALLCESALAYGPQPQVAPPVPTAAPYAPALYPTAPTLGNAPIVRSAPTAQPAVPVATRPAPLPEPIFWRQHLFLIP